ncbi:sensor histidine kinase [Bizionia paragorgiae]|uniref:Two component regulator propeller n=1 Tax=Bizionia paragorgiae TaxID=283786 RepID=A0A1H3W528_BIZPA|nr:two-component regulator propeller domain-containing protein [Bizionia paragorgiae]SDZ82215.1 Two component regulator propeller [Bizionia paragorgiae]
MKSITLYILLTLCTFLINTVEAQHDQLRGYTLEHGLPQSQVYDMVQDSIGYLWLGTQGGGLSRFDGASFKSWNEKDGLLSNYIHALHIANGVLYIGTRNGLSMRINNQFLNSESPQVLQILNRDDTVYLATVKGVYKVIDNKTVKAVSLHPTLDSSSINHIVFSDKAIWLATSSGLWKTSSFKNKNISQIEKGNFSALAQYKHNVYASTFNDGTFVIDTRGLEDSFLIKEPLRINALSIQNENELWVATDNSGITVIDIETHLEKFRLNTTNGLAVPHVRKVIRDKQSALWIATSGGGFYKYFQNNFKHFDKNSGLKDNRVYAVHATKNAIWNSNAEAGLVAIDSLGIHHINVPKLFSGVKIKTITSDSNGDIWAGSDGRGLLYRETVSKDSLVFTMSTNYAVKIDTLKITRTKNHVFNSDTGFPYDWIKDIEIINKTLWIATYSSGILKAEYNPETKGIAILKRFGIQENINDLLLKDIAVDEHNRLWFASKNGYLGYIENDTVTSLGKVLNTTAEIVSLLFSGNTLYLGTSGKGVWWTEIDDNLVLKKLQGEKALYSQNIYQLIFDNQGYLWVGSERGIDKVKLSTSHTIEDVFHFGRDDGFLGIETCLNAIDIDASGNLWIGAIYGLTQYQPSTTASAQRVPQLFITDIEVNYKPLDSLWGLPFTNEHKTLQLTPDQTQISFYYKTVDLNHPKEVYYRFKLNDSPYSSWTQEHTQHFSGLAYGDYEFTVQSRNARGITSQPKSFRFFIESPLYKKNWFIVLVVSILILIVVLIAYQYVKRLQQQNKEEWERLELKNNLLELEQKALRLQMNPHFIFNVLNGIKAMAIAQPDKMNTTINSFATLLRETLLNSRKDTISLEQELNTLNHYIQVEQLMASKPFIYSIKVDKDIAVEEVLIPPMLVQPFVENAIRHGILKGKKPGELSISFYSTADFLYCKIEDNGIGIFTSQQQKTKTDHQSVALEVTKERIESLSGEGAVLIEEVKNDDGTVKGTTITFKIPLETDY